MPTYVHGTNRVGHVPFDECFDTDLYIDLEKLPPNTAKVTFDNEFDQLASNGVEIPIFIAAPIMVLRSIDAKLDCNEKPLLDILDYSLNVDPQPESEDCTVCQLVSWLLCKCCDFEEACSRLSCQPQCIVFEVLREFLVRLSPKPLLISTWHLEYVKRYNYLTEPIHNFVISPFYPNEFPTTCDMKDKYMNALLWTNGFIYLMRRDILKRGVYSLVGGFVVVNLIRLLRSYMFRKLPECNEFGKIPQPLYMLEAMVVLKQGALEPIMKLARSVFIGLIDYDCNWFSYDTPPPKGFRRIDTYKFQENTRAVMENILAMNVPEVFYPCVDVERLYFHTNTCDDCPEKCYCKFARYLRSVDC